MKKEWKWKWDWIDVNVKFPGFQAGNQWQSRRCSAEVDVWTEEVEVDYCKYISLLHETNSTRVVELVSYLDEFLDE